MQGASPSSRAGRRDACIACVCVRPPHVCVRGRAAMCVKGSPYVRASHAAWARMGRVVGVAAAPHDRNVRWGRESLISYGVCPAAIGRCRGLRRGGEPCAAAVPRVQGVHMARHQPSCVPSSTGGTSKRREACWCCAHIWMRVKEQVAWQRPPPSAHSCSCLLGITERRWSCRWVTVGHSHICPVHRWERGHRNRTTGAGGRGLPPTQLPQ